MTTLFIPTALRAFTDRQSQIEINATTVGEVITTLTSLYPDLAPHIVDEEGKLRGFVNVFVGQTNIRESAGLDTPVASGDEVSIVPAIAGGSQGPESIVTTAKLRDGQFPHLRGNALTAGRIPSLCGVTSDAQWGAMRPIQTWHQVSDRA